MLCFTWWHNVIYTEVGGIVAAEKLDLPEQKTEILEWIEPEVRVLAVTETAFNPGSGGDGGIADCSAS